MYTHSQLFNFHFLGLSGLAYDLPKVFESLKHLWRLLEPKSLYTDRTNSVEHILVSVWSK